MRAEQAMLEEIYLKALELAKELKQTVVFKKNEFYITLEQLEKILKRYDE